MAKKNYLLYWRILVVITVITPIVLYFVWVKSVSNKLETAEKELRSNGQPVTFVDLAKIAEKDKNRDNAVDYILIAGKLEDWPTEPDRFRPGMSMGMGMPMPGMGGMGPISGMSSTLQTNSQDEDTPPIYGYRPYDIFNMSYKDKENLPKYLEANTKQVQALSEAMNISRFRDKTNWRKGFESGSEGLYEFEQATLLVQYLAISYVNDGKIDEAVNLLCKWYEVVNRSSQNRPLSFYQMTVSINCRNILDDTIRWIIKENIITNYQLARLYSQIIPIDHKAVLPSILQTESVFMIFRLREYHHHQKWDSSVDHDEAKFYKYSGLTKLNAIKYLEISQKLQTASQYDFHRMQKEFKTISHKVNQLGNHIYNPVKDAFPDIIGYINIIGNSIAGQEILKIMLANEMYKNENGRYADSLEILKAYKKNLLIQDIFTSSDLYGYQPITKNEVITKYFIWSKTDKSSVKIKDIIDKLIDGNFGTAEELEEYLHNYTIYEMK